MSAGGAVLGPEVDCYCVSAGGGDCWVGVEDLAL